MTRQPSQRMQLSAQRFRLRRLEHALVRRDVAMSTDPMRAQARALAAGAVLAAIGVAGCAILALVKPQGSIGSAAIVVSRESGAMYVRIEDTLHPVFNLTSARLVTRSSAAPVVVADRAMAGLRRGPRLGIPGAPGALGSPLGATAWTACDGNRTVVLAGVSLPPLDSSQTVLAAPLGDDAATTYLLYEGKRARVDLRDRAVARALHLDGQLPLRVSRALLDSLPEAPAIAVPHIAGAGAPGPPALGGFAVGSVVRVSRAERAEYFVVLGDGVQRVEEAAADVIRFGYGGPDETPTVTPTSIAAVPLVEALPVADFPHTTRAPVAEQDGAMVCVRWAPSNIVVESGDTSALDEVEVADLAQSDGEGPRVDAVALPRGRTAFVRSAGVTGDDGAGGALFVVTDSGIAFGIRGTEDASFLGLTASPEPAPWSMIAQLPTGPELSVQAASVPRDTATS